MLQRGQSNPCNTCDGCNVISFMGAQGMTERSLRVDLERAASRVARARARCVWMTLGPQLHPTKKSPLTAKLVRRERGGRSCAKARQRPP
jgi:hypothetical protein